AHHRLRGVDLEQRPLQRDHGPDDHAPEGTGCGDDAESARPNVGDHPEALTAPRRVRVRADRRCSGRLAAIRVPVTIPSPTRELTHPSTSISTPTTSRKNSG